MKNVLVNDPKIVFHVDTNVVANKVKLYSVFFETSTAFLKP
jgi:hypothetical protein